MSQRPRKKISPSPLDFYRGWCQRRIADAQGKNLARLAESESTFLGLLESSQDVKTLCQHPLERLHPVLLALYEIDTQTAISPGPHARRQQRTQKLAAYKAAHRIREYIDILEQAPEYRHAVTQERKKTVEEWNQALDEDDPIKVAEGVRVVALVDKITLLKNAQHVAEQDYARLSRVLPDPAIGHTIAQPRGTIPRRGKHRPRGSFADGLTPEIYLLATAIEELIGQPDWWMVARLLNHFGAREFSVRPITNVKARSRVATFRKAYSKQLNTLRDNHARRAAHVFAGSVSPKKS